MDTAIGHRATEGPFGRPRPKTFRVQGKSGNGGAVFFGSFLLAAKEMNTYKLVRAKSLM